MSKYHIIRNLKFTADQLMIQIDGEDKIYDLNKISKILSNASDIEKNTYEISPSGYGIHWHLVDEDISVDGLLGIVHRPETVKIKA
ncbi:MAG: hypothetical protein BWK80_07545 [Desulfobacteraceae bacterium IS3]|nr:MAG: hypothetical protein BWK80_07545 [Desulfobacteraceae bacterium IS3]